MNTWLVAVVAALGTLFLAYVVEYERQARMNRWPTAELARYGKLTRWVAVLWLLAIAALWLT